MMRRRGREMAVQMLYSLELGPFSDNPCKGDGCLPCNECDEQAMKSCYNGYLELNPSLSEDEPSFEFAKALIEGVLRHIQSLDAIIQRHSKNWRIDRMSLVDRNILRIGVFELYYCPDIPEKVAINEAIELAKKFSTDDAVSFINGVLDAVLKEIHISSSKINIAID